MARLDEEAAEDESLAHTPMVKYTTTKSRATHIRGCKRTSYGGCGVHERSVGGGAHCFNSSLQVQASPNEPDVNSTIGIASRCTRNPTRGDDSLGIHRSPADAYNNIWWINSANRRYRLYVALRVAEILSISKPNDWRYVPSSLNPADIATKPTDWEDLERSNLWTNGPKFLQEEKRSGLRRLSQNRTSPWSYSR